MHLFLNTGMNREGLDEGDLEDILMLLKKYPQLQIEGVMSHLATADEPDRTQTDEQIALYKHLYAKIVAAGHTPLRRHLGNSAGYAKLSDPLFTAARTGYVFYGYNPFEKNDPHFAVYANLKPALSVTSTIVSTHQLPA
ncbi:MAG: alanine racemase [bacterium]|nr:alanine racemase [bacterium]